MGRFNEAVAAGMELEEAAGPRGPHLAAAGVVTDGALVLAADFDREALLGKRFVLQILTDRVGIERNDARQKIADVGVLPAVVFGIALGPLEADLVGSPVVFLFLRDGGVLIDGRGPDFALRGPGDGPSEHFAGLERVVGFGAVAEQGLEDPATTEVVGPGER